MKILVSPHNDDETLFAALTILREKPLVVVVFDGLAQQRRGLAVRATQRRDETIAACAILGVDVEFLGFRDDAPPLVCEITAGLRSFAPETVYAPAWETDGHPQHNMVSEACVGLGVAEWYLTYTTHGKSTSERKVKILDGSWIGLKLRALACYESQFSLDPKMGCWPHFLRDQTEYYA